MQKLKTRTSVSRIKARLYKFLRPGFAKELDLCDRLVRAKVNKKKYVDTCEDKAHGREFSFYPSYPE